MQSSIKYDIRDLDEMKKTIRMGCYLLVMSDQVSSLRLPTPFARGPWETTMPCLFRTPDVFFNTLSGPQAPPGTQIESVDDPVGSHIRTQGTLSSNIGVGPIVSLAIHRVASGTALTRDVLRRPCDIAGPA